MQRSRSKSMSGPRTKRARQASRTPSRAPTLRMRTMALAAPSVGLGASVTTVLRTSFFTNITAAVGTGIFNCFLKPGSAFDPCGDLAAIQPQMYDQFAAQYNRYKVNTATIRIKIIGGSSGAAAGNYAWVCAAYPAVDPTALGTYQGAASQQYAKTIGGGFQVVAAGGVGIGAEHKIIKYNKLNHNSVVGVKSDAWDIGALVTADPTALQFMVLPMYFQSNVASASTWVLEIDIFQNVTFSQKKNVVDA